MSEGKNRKIEVALHPAHPIACVIEKQTDLLFCENAQLGIIAYGDTRAAVIQEFSNEFSALWDIIAKEKDARLLKRRLIELVRKVETHGDKQGTGDQRGAD